VARSKENQMSGTVAGPITQLVINKRRGNEEWANVYHVFGADAASLQTGINGVITMERAQADANTEFVNYVVRPFPGPGEGTATPIGLVGLNPATEMLPGFCVQRVDFPAPTGRPSRKYYRYTLTPGDTDHDLILAARHTQIQGQYEADFAALPANFLVDVDGQVLGPPRLARQVGMRQLKRGSKRKPPTP
jgi:hypothetical protein